MAKQYFCANCGMRLNVYRKALPKYGRILDLVDPHECTDEPMELDLTPIDIPLPMSDEKDNKFVKKLNKLSPPPSFVPDRDLKDRRPSDQVKSSAPESLLANIKDMRNTIPSGPLMDSDDIISKSEPESD